MANTNPALAGLTGKGNKATPDFISENVSCQADELAVLRDIQAGFPKYKSLLIKRVNESSRTFEMRQQMPLLFDAVTPTIRDIVGKLLILPPMADGVSPAFEDLTYNIDGRGTGFIPFLNNLFLDASWAGHSFVLVDHTQTPAADSLGAEKALGARPYWVHIRKDQVCNFQTTVVDGIMRLLQISVAELAEEPDGFDVATIPQWRVLRRRPDGATWQLYQKRKVAGKEPQIIPVSEETYFLASGGEHLPEIPLVPFYARQCGFLESRPQHIELARVVQADYNVASDMEHNHYMSSYPTLVGKGITADEMKSLDMGASNGVALPQDNQSLDYIAGAGQGVELGLQIRESLRRMMCVLGNRMFDTDKPDRVTATAKVIDESIDANWAFQLANSFEDALNNAVDITQKYLDGQEGGEIVLAPNQKAMQQQENQDAMNAALQKPPVNDASSSGSVVSDS